MKEGIKPAIRSLHADGDAVIIFFDAAGTARDGKPYINTYAWFFDMRDSKVTRLGLLQQPGDLWRRVKP